MRRFLLLTTSLLLMITALHSPAVRTQDPEKGLPSPTDYPEAAANCKRRVNLSPWVGTPALEGPNTFQCVLSINTCEGVKTFKSGVRVSGAGMCADYWAAHEALVNREICCPSSKPLTPEEKKRDNKDACEEPQDHGPPWIDPATDCKDLQETFTFIEQNPIYLPRGGSVNCKLFTEICGERMLMSEATIVAPDPRQDPPPRGGPCQRARIFAGDPFARRKVCCDQWRTAVQTGTPCDPRSDIDCDGRSNSQDADDFVAQAEFSLKTTLPELPFQWSPKELLPNEVCPNCLWELIGMTVSHFSATVPSRHCIYRYQGHWLCRSSKRLVDSERKEKSVPGPCSS